MSWNQIVARVTPYVVKIETPNGHGTGFLCLYNQDRSLFGIATALHVVAHADDWKEPIRLWHYPSGTTIFLNGSDRAILRDRDSDSAVILLRPGELKVPDEPIPLLPTTTTLEIGADVGWLGFPALADSTLCFFSGIISAKQEWRHAYLIDGVSIHGVSGGPVIYATEAEGVQIVGTISAYVSNRATGDTLPGLAVARDVSHFHDTISKIRTLDDAGKQKATQEGQSEAVSSVEPPPAKARRKKRSKRAK